MALTTMHTPARTTDVKGGPQFKVLAGSTGPQHMYIPSTSDPVWIFPAPSAHGRYVVLLPAESTGCLWVMGLGGLSIPLNLCFAIAGLRSSVCSRSHHAVHSYLYLVKFLCRLVMDCLARQFLVTLKGWYYLIIYSTETGWTCYFTSAQNGWGIRETDGFNLKS